MRSFHIPHVIGERQHQERQYLEFLRVASMSAGIYFLPAGGNDPQRPHTEDEVYYIIKGRGHIRGGSQDRAVQTGDFVFIDAGEDHRFHSITEDLTLLVFFAPAESS
ncbi:MAG TPA: cupin domain-containing protein [Terriglobia bacterium]|nr:cupin domain-containing protein [Terriglobia bacterium]